MKTLVVGTRGSRLALIQTEEVLSKLRANHPGREFEVRIVRTGGDKSTAPLASLGLGIFVKELEDALLKGVIDIAVHSLKDLPPLVTPGLTLAAVGPRQDPRDVLVARSSLDLEVLPPGTRIGTSSPRRKALLGSLHPNLVALPIRGNVETRLGKVDSGEFDGVILAAAGIIRLGLEDRISQYLDPVRFIPAPGQGALGIETRKEDGQTTALAATVDDTPTRRAVIAERAFLERMGIGCQVPSGAYARTDGETMVMHAFTASTDGAQLFAIKARSRADNPHKLAMEAHQRLIEKGAGILMSSSSES